MWDELREELVQRALRTEGAEALLARLEDAVRSGTQSPSGGVAELLHLLD